MWLKIETGAKGVACHIENVEGPDLHSEQYCY